MTRKLVLGAPGPFQVIDSLAIETGPRETGSREIAAREPVPSAYQTGSTEAESRSSIVVLNPPHRKDPLEPKTENLRSVDHPMDPPRRRYSCPNYATCLDLAAALNWDNFTCRGCSGEVNENLLWRARQALRRDEIARKVCHDLPEIQLHSGDIPPPKSKRVAGKR